MGEIPQHWDVTRTKFVARLRSGHTPSRQHPEYWQNCTIPWFGLADVWQIRDGRREYVCETSEKISELGLANSAARLLPRGTVILSRTASVGFSAIMDTDMATTQDFVNWVCGPRVRPEYLLYVFRSMGHEFHRLTMGSTHQTIYMPDVGRFTTPIPPLDEQDRIVAFIRGETAKIDALVAKKERLIELLHEKRTALITRAVTKGLDPTVSMQNPGVEWLGETPAHWKLVPIRRLWRRCDYGISESLAGSGSIRVLTMAHLQDGEIQLPEEGCAEEVPQELILEHQDLLFNRTNSRELVAKVGIFRGNSADRISFASYLVRIASSNAVDSEFLNYLLNSTAVLSRARAISLLSVNQANLNPTRYGEILLCVPPKSEQITMREALDAASETIRRLTRGIQEGIDRLREFRAALVSAAVTGKIDVRENAA